MFLPNRETAVVSEQKITGYLLSETHLDGRHKARFFKAFGYSVDRWRLLADTLRQHIDDYEIAKTEISSFGTRYVIEGIINTPAGRSAALRSVWFIRNGEDQPQFVTAYPLPRD